MQPGLDLTERVLYRDNLVIIIDKPAGLPVHEGPRGGDNLERHFGQLKFGLPHPPGLGHRLDRDTSGCLALGRHRRALARLGRLFAAGLARKTYWALVRGEPPQSEGTVDLPLAKQSIDRGWSMKVDDGGRKAVTDYRILGHDGDLTWLELEPRTGRTHQLRVHCATLGCPVVGDNVYGNDTARPLSLLARRLVLPLYAEKPEIVAEAPPPLHMTEGLHRCGHRVASDA